MTTIKTNNFNFQGLGVLTKTNAVVLSVDDEIVEVEEDEIVEIEEDDEEQPPVYGCTDPNALNYYAGATEDDGSCIYPPPPPIEED